MRKLIRVTGYLIAVLAISLTAAAQDISREELRSLDEQVQEIKSDVLSIAAELNNLEERLLYPSNTQIAVFVAMDKAAGFRLDAVQVDIDGELASHHIYSFKELEALQNGGVQRIYTGNIATGDHAINVRMKGKLSNGSDFEVEDGYSFDKGVEPKVLGVTILAASGSNGIRFGEW